MKKEEAERKWKEKRQKGQKRKQGKEERKERKKKRKKERRKKRKALSPFGRLRRRSGCSRRRALVASSASR